MHRRLAIGIPIVLFALPFAAQAAHAQDPVSSATTGYFVVSDLSAAPGGIVQFWGAQWSQANALSAGLGPDAFKGYADTVDNAGCPTQWSADPGNSSAPPASLPSTITVIVTSSVTKAGPLISGDVVELATIQVQPGYQDDPGHPGLGTVTAVSSCGGGGGTSS